MTATQIETPRLYEKATAAVIRKLLKATYPTVKFSVTVGKGSMVSAVRVLWTDGPERSQVAALVECFKKGAFDGTIDSYVSDESRRLLIDGVHYRPGVEYVSTQRHSSKEG